MRLPVWPFHEPSRNWPANAAIRSSTAWTSGTTSWPSTSMRVPRGARNATCSTARFSVTLIFSPRNIASRRSATPRSLGEPQQQPHRLLGDAVLRVVEREPGALDGEARRPAGIVGEQGAQMRVLDRRVMRLQRPPGRALGQSLAAAHGSLLVWLGQRLALGLDRPQQFLPGTDERLRTLALQLRAPARRRRCPPWRISASTAAPRRRRAAGPRRPRRDRRMRAAFRPASC